MSTQGYRALYGAANASLSSESGNNFRFTPVLTDAQSQGTKVASKVARDGKTEGFSRILH